MQNRRHDEIQKVMDINLPILENDRGDLCIKQCMARIGVPTEYMQNLDYIQQLLRMKMVQEWEENIDNYQGYLSEDLVL